VTLEGFWADPPGYVEDLVWPNYVRYHSWMYEDGDVESGKFNKRTCSQEHIVLCPGEGQKSMLEMLGWGLDMVKGAISERL
jgi:nicotinamide/nicotinate riboside kinase